MKLLWVAADKPGSKVIRWGLDSDCSHFAVAFDEGEANAFFARGITFHSYGSGTQIVWLKTFLETYEIIHAIEPVKKLSLEEEESVYQAVLAAEDGRDYDYPAIGWFVWRALLAKIGYRKIDGYNRWQRDSARLCTGVAPTILKALGVELKVDDPEMVPPHDLYEMLKRTGKFVDATTWRQAANEV